MKAILLQVHDNSNAANLTTIPKPVGVPGQVIVQMKAAALNHRDIYILDNLYPGISSGSILGADGAGLIVYPDTLLGKRVILKCGRGWKCDVECPEEPYSILGLLPNPGTLAEYVSVEKECVVEAPPHLSLVECAAIPLAGLTAYRSVVTLGKVTKGSNVLIPGIGGGVAVWALQFAVSLGANVWVTSSSKEKITQAIQLGAQGGYLYTDPDWVDQASDNMYNVVIDGAAGPNMKSYVRLLQLGGRIVVFGAVAGSNVTLNAPYLWFKHVTILGASMGSDREFCDMMALIETQKIKPFVGKVFPSLESFDDAIQYLRSGKQMGKVVIELLHSSL